MDDLCMHITEMWDMKPVLLEMEFLMSKSDKIESKEGQIGRVHMQDLLENKITRAFPSSFSSLLHGPHRVS